MAGNNLVISVLEELGIRLDGLTESRCDGQDPLDHSSQEY